MRNGRVWKKVHPGPNERATYEALLYRGNCLTTSAVMVRKEWLDRVSGFIEDPVDLVRDFRLGRISDQGPVHVGSEDYDLWLRLAKAGARFEFVDEMLGEYLVHGSNATKAARCLIDSQFAVLDRHFRNGSRVSAWERLRRRRRRALVYYAVARSLQDDGKRIEALRLFWQCALTYPLIIWLYAAVLLNAFGWPRPEVARG